MPAQASDVPSGTVEISDIPDFDLYQRRRDQLYPKGDPQTSLPTEFPTQSSTEYAWSGRTLRPEDLVLQLTTSEIQEIDDALKRLKKTRLHVSDITKENFSLPTLGPRLLQACSSVMSGPGVVILRGMDPTKRCLQDNILVFAGVGSYFGDKRGVQGREKDFLVHLRDAGHDHVPDHLRPSPFANQYQAFHTDFCDVIGMYVQQTALHGGRSYWASTAKIYNDIASERPHLIKTLSDATWPFQSSIEGGEVRLRPILFTSKATSQPFFCFSRTNLTGTSVVPRQAHTQQLNNEQADALDEVHFAAERNCMTVQHQRGDMYFLNNLRVLHGREAFLNNDPDTADSSPSSPNGAESPNSNSSTTSIDSATTTSRRERHIMRIWLRNEACRSDADIPELLKPRWEEVFGPEQISRGKWAFDKVHTKSLIMASLNDEIESFS